MLPKSRPTRLSPPSSTITEASPAWIARTACCRRFMPTMSSIIQRRLSPSCHARSIARSGARLKDDTPRPSTSRTVRPALSSAASSARANRRGVVVSGPGLRSPGSVAAPTMATPSTLRVHAPGLDTRLVGPPRLEPLLRPCGKTPADSDDAARLEEQEKRHCDAPEDLGHILGGEA